MSKPYVGYDPLLEVTVEVDGAAYAGHALGRSGNLVHVGWVRADGRRQLGWLPVDAVTF
jgi:hypothetical protein